MDTVLQSRIHASHHTTPVSFRVKSSLLLVLVLAADVSANKRYTLPHMVTTYREDKLIVVEMSYAIPRAGIAASGGNRDNVRIEQTISVVDRLGNSYHSSFARPTSLPPAGSTSIRRNYLLAHEQIRLPPNEYDLYVGVRDLKVRSTGSFHSICRAPGEGGRFDISDLQLATQIISPRDEVATRQNLVIHPNPLRLYRKGERVFVFLELYNLHRDEFGQTQFEIAYRMARPVEQELQIELFESLQRNSSYDEEDSGQSYLVPSKHRQGVRIEKTWEGREGQTTIATQYVGDATQDLTYLEFDIAQLADGIHKLTLIATDLATKEMATRSVIFRVIEPLPEKY